MIEIWRDIENYPGYQVSNLGRVRSLDYLHSGRIHLLYTNTNNGYVIVQFRKDNKRVTKKVHRLMAEAFLPNPQHLETVNHKDECKTNNFIYINPDGTVNFEKSNLEWLSRGDNTRYGTRTERVTKVLINHPSFSRQVGQYTLDGKLIAKYPSIAEAHRITGIASSIICKCCKGNGYTAGGFIWKYLD